MNFEETLRQASKVLNSDLKDKDYQGCMGIEKYPGHWQRMKVLCAACQKLSQILYFHGYFRNLKTTEALSESVNALYNLANNFREMSQILAAHSNPSPQTQDIIKKYNWVANFLCKKVPEDWETHVRCANVSPVDVYIHVVRTARGLASNARNGV